MSKAFFTTKQVAILLSPVRVLKTLQTYRYDDTELSHLIMEVLIILKIYIRSVILAEPEPKHFYDRPEPELDLRLRLQL